MVKSMLRIMPCDVLAEVRKYTSFQCERTRHTWKNDRSMEIKQAMENWTHKLGHKNTKFISKSRQDRTVIDMQDLN